MSDRIYVSRGVLATVAGLFAVFLGLRAVAVEAVDPHAGYSHATATGPDAADADGMPSVTRSVINYAVPAIQLVRDDGKQVSLSEELNDGRPVVLNFVYTTCTGICPLASHIFSQLQHKLGAGRDRVHLVSISVDPEEDTPTQLRAYARKYSAGPSWQHYTGTAAASIAAQRAFDVYKGDKMGHTPVTLVRTEPGGPWVRLDGFATADMLLEEVQRQSQNDGRQMTTAVTSTRR